MHYFPFFYNCNKKTPLLSLKLLQSYLSIFLHHSIRRLVVPRAGVYVLVTVAEVVFNVDVAVSEDVEVGIFFGLDAADVLDDVLALGLEGESLAGVLMTRRTPREAYPHRKIRVEKVGEQELRNLAREHPFDDGIADTLAAEAVAVTHIDTLAANLHQPRLAKYLDAKFVVEVVIMPNIVVAGEIIHLDARLHEFGNFCEETVKTLGNHVVPFVPIVKNVAQKIQRLGVGLDEIEPTDYAPLPLQRNLFVGCAEVKVGCKICLHFGGRYWVNVLLNRNFVINT